MSQTSWHNYGYGICINDIRTPEEERTPRLLKLLDRAPIFKSKVEEWLKDCVIINPTYEDILEYDQVCGMGLAYILAEVIKEAEGICLTACDDRDSKRYLIYQPSYPWNLSDRERNLEQWEIDDMIDRYVRIITDEVPLCEEQEVANGDD